jgi:hypothetical protein
MIGSVPELDADGVLIEDAEPDAGVDSDAGVGAAELA